MKRIMFVIYHFYRSKDPIHIKHANINLKPTTFKKNQKACQSQLLLAIRFLFDLYLLYYQW